MNVTAWPGRFDPRTPRVLTGLLAGLAAKLRHYRARGARGFTAAIRRAVQFVKAKGYPSRWWVRRFALALLRHGVPPSPGPLNHANGVHEAQPLIYFSQSPTRRGI